MLSSGEKLFIESLTQTKCPENKYLPNETPCMYEEKLIQTIEDVLSYEDKKRNEAEKILEIYAKQDFSKFLYILVSELANEFRNDQTRQISAVIMRKYLLHSPIFREKWDLMPKQVKNEIKSIVVGTLGSPKNLFRKAAGLVIAGICKVESPLEKEWPEIIMSLCQKSYDLDFTLKLSSLQTIGYICE